MLKINSCWLAGILLGILLYQCPIVASQPMDANAFDDLFSLDSPHSIQTKLQPSPAFSTIRSTAVKPSVIVSSASPQTEATSYLATLSGGISSLNSTINQTSLPQPNTTPSTFTRSTTSTFSTQELLSIARSPELVLALQRMSFTPQSRVSLDALRQRGGKVMFKNLTELGSQYATFDALAWLSKDPTTQGAWVLFIAEKHRKAPVEALASLITHEALHADFQNSYCEEEHAWLAEVTAWQQFKAQNPTLQHIPKGWYGLVDRLNTIETALAQQTLKAMIRNNPGYAGLQEASPYFRYSPFSMPTDTSQQTGLGKSAMTVSPNHSLLQQQPAVTLPSQKTATMTTLLSLSPKPFPVAANGRPKLTLRPLKAW